MTDYPAVRRSTKPSWKKAEVRRKWQGLFAAFIAIVLFLALINLVLKTFSLKKYIGQSKWDSRASFVSLLSTVPPSIFVYQPDRERMAILALPSDTLLETGKSDEPLKKLANIYKDNLPQEVVNIMSVNFGADIANFVDLSEEIKLDEEASKKLFKKFASISTPLAIITGTYDSKVKGTNLTRIDAIRLWWRIKGLSIDKVKLVDLGSLTEEVVISENTKVLGVDDTAFNLAIAEYLESQKLAGEDQKVEIENASGYVQAGNLAFDFVSNVGINVKKMNQTSKQADKTIIITSEKNDVSGYLARLFNCDIVGSSGEGEIRIILGRDFASRYYR